MNMTNKNMGTVEEAVEIVEENVTKFSKFEIKMLFNPAFNEIKVNEIESKEDRISLIKLKIKFGKVAKELEEYEKEVVESFKDENYKNLESESSKEDATEEIKTEFKKLQENINVKINEVCIEEYNKEVEIEGAFISEECFYKMVSTIELTALGGYEYLYNKLVK